MSREISGLSVIVTGGARGIGKATVERFARQGAKVAIGDRDVDLAALVAEPFGDRAMAAPLDVTDPESWRVFLDAVAPLGPFDVLVNNAGIMPLGSVLKEPDAVTKAIVDVNLHGVILGTKAVAPGMVERGRGHIVNVASAVGRVAVADGATYTASKFAAVGFSEAIRSELRPYGIDVSAVLPTVVQTELAAGVSQARGVKAVTADDVAKVIEQAVRSPKPEMWVPRWSQAIYKVGSVMPRRLMDAMAHLTHADTVLSTADTAARAAYEERARRSAGPEA
ncbi:SDR family oxidoreductase [Nocardioides marmotae]|uniref:SDR family NAD(P)-dependent oxidoreductase n=1 Tax=Nocardioides marmotae TaxID=2663857 RepID=A0A6I3JAV3_9ACTN|nr:SDR family oxidoreductase [Nocardioides marmotae]MCR6031599.1 SDR family NAD(P)-dependent oxidoreductase [Gordonia jinghuaiqii]MBC9733242.1 SDR family oxidoreductase [Nocardioides marmotae]MTB84353.1 SDR family NAD(P)-dependent oxidoreductase [Nocardioides marmotae]MTB95238.1 SDR family NAD(P)-dependent oxidoreductase [Nocardioides marmotae]QKE02287.1 SDR family oxidoreductase [Nocardioides marmotae]